MQKLKANKNYIYRLKNFHDKSYTKQGLNISDTSKSDQFNFHTWLALHICPASSCISEIFVDFNANELLQFFTLAI